MPGQAQYSRVRVVQLLRPAEAYDGWRLNQRPPRVGDIGTIVEIAPAPGGPTSYIVESSNPDGTACWLGDFFAEELEPVDERAGSGEPGSGRARSEERQ